VYPLHRFRIGHKITPAFLAGRGASVRIFLNGEEKAVSDSLTVSQLLQQLGLGERRIAVEINEEIVPRSRHAARRLSGGDRIEVVFAVGGG
jgi:sulfur carrier protein